MSRLELIPNVFGGERCGSRGGIGLVPSCRKASPIQAGAEHVRNRPLLCLPLLISLGKSGQGGPPANHPHKAWPPPIAGAVICTACIVHRSVVRQHVFASPAMFLRSPICSEQEPRACVFFASKFTGHSRVIRLRLCRANQRASSVLMLLVDSATRI